MRISKKEFEASSKIKEMINDRFDEKDLIRIVRGINPKLIVKSDNGESKNYDSINEAAKGIGVSRQTLMYAYGNDKMMITRQKGVAKAFYIERLS